MKKTLLYLPLFFVIFSAFPTFVQGQMSGTVTIDAGSAASSTNFKNWYSFWRSLQGLSRTDGGSTLTAGISASVTVDVKSDLTEDSTVRFPAITGMGSTKTITIKGNGKLLIFGGAYEAISMEGGDYFSIQNLTIRHKGTSASSSACIRFYNNSDYNTIDGCTLEFSGLSSGSTNGSAYVAFSVSSTNFNAATSILTGSYNTISNNLCRTTNSGNPGPAYGITIMGSTSGFTTTAHNNTISGNTIQNFYYCAIQNQYSNGNQFVNNNISRANSASNNCNTLLLGIISGYTYSTSRSTTYRTNNIHDLPYISCPASGGVNDFIGIYAEKNYGSTSYPFMVDSNTFKGLAIYNNPTVGYFRENNKVKIIRNTSDNIQSYSNVNTAILWDLHVCNDISFIGNRLTKSYLAGLESYFFNADSLWAPNYGMVDVSSNVVDGNTFFADAFMLFPNEGEFKIHGNRIQNNSITGGSGGYLFAIATQEFEDLLLTNNLITNNLGHDGFIGLYVVSGVSGNYTCKIMQNTVHSDGTKAPSGKGYDNNSSVISPYYHNAVYFSGNIFYITDANSGIIAGVDVNDTSKIELWNNNTYYSNNIGTEYWFEGVNTVYTYSDWKTLGISGNGDNNIHPNFADISNGDFHSIKWQTQNDVVTDTDNPRDLNGALRNTPKSDRGVYEQYSDLKAVKSSFSIASSVCSGTSISGLDITVKNLFDDTAYNFKVSYSVNGGSVVTQKVTSKILPNDSMKIVFFQPLQLSKPGKARIAIYVDASDDNPSNDSFIFNTTVKAAPGGSKFTASAKPTKTIYRGGIPWDIMFPGEAWMYNFTAPRSYNNSDYGSKWSASVYASTAKGTPVSGASLTTPSGSTDAEVKFLTNNLNLQDSFIRVCVKINDLTTGCDTSYCWSVYINSIVIPDFTYPSVICGNDTAYFINLSYVKAGGMIFHWNFGTGKAADTSNAVDPWFIYSTPGTYKVKLTTYTNPYGYPTYDSATITVKAQPSASFTRVNACEGELVKFTNTSTPSTSSYLWKFGDGGTSTTKDPTHDYASPGQYTVKLFVSNGGCTDSASLKAFEFPKPKPGFNATNNVCSNTPVKFTNTSTIVSGIFASYWDFGGGNISTQANPTYTFGYGGTQTVSLLLVSDFGCKDSISKTITLKSAPLVSFTNTELCSLDSTTFTNTTPAISGTVPGYFWDFGDGTKSTVQNPWHRWSATGPVNVKLRVSLDNGCKDSVTKSLTVRTQPKVNFTSNNPVCSGTTVVFLNNTTWAKGTVNFDWNFGDATSSTLSDPSHTYVYNNTTTANVTLCAAVDSACRTCITKSVTVNEIPHTCDFVALPDYAYGYYGMKCTPKNASTGDTSPQAGVTYKWNFHNSGNVTANWGQYNFQSDGTYNVTMCAEIATTKCSCCVTKQVVMDRSGVHAVDANTPKVYPNPNQGNFRIELGENTSGPLHVQLFNTAGKLVYENTENSNALQVHTSGLASGIYLLHMVNKGNTYRTMLQITD